MAQACDMTDGCHLNENGRGIYGMHAMAKLMLVIRSPAPHGVPPPRRRIGRKEVANARNTSHLVWTNTPTERYFVRRGRGKQVVDEVLGDGFGGVLVSDFYAAYNHYPGLKQRCWVHLLRDIRDLKALYPKDARLSRWASAVKELYTKALYLMLVGLAVVGVHFIIVPWYHPGGDEHYPLWEMLDWFMAVAIVIALISTFVHKRRHARLRRQHEPARAHIRQLRLLRHTRRGDPLLLELVAPAEGKR